MIDMTLCPGGSCPQRRQCLRHRLRAAGRRAAFAQPPHDPRTGRCAHLVDIDTIAPTEAQVREEAYRLWQAAGKPEGHDLAHWQQASEALAARHLERLTP